LSDEHGVATDRIEYDVLAENKELLTLQIAQAENEVK